MEVKVTRTVNVTTLRNATQLNATQSKRSQRRDSSCSNTTTIATYLAWDEQQAKRSYQFGICRVVWTQRTIGKHLRCVRTQVQETDKAISHKQALDDSYKHTYIQCICIYILLVHLYVCMYIQCSVNKGDTHRSLCERAPCVYAAVCWKMFTRPNNSNNRKKTCCISRI